jgi:hypothetical protein
MVQGMEPPFAQYMDRIHTFVQGCIDCVRDSQSKKQFTRSLIDTTNSWMVQQAQDGIEKVIAFVSFIPVSDNEYRIISACSEAKNPKILFDMIQELTTNSQHLFPSRLSVSQPYINGGNGIVRYNSNSGRLEVNDGSAWMPLGNQWGLNLSNDAINAIDWVKNKIKEEEELKALSKDHPAIRFAVENLERAKQQLDVTINLSKEYAT